MPKRRNKKTAPQPVLALRAPLTSRRERDAEKLGLRPQTVSASFPPPSARRGRTNGGREIPICPAAHRKSCRKGRLHCLRRKPSLQSPGSFEEYPIRGINSGYPAFGGTSDRGALSSPLRCWFVSLGKQRNEQTNSPSAQSSLPCQPTACRRVALNPIKAKLPATRQRTKSPLPIKEAPYPHSRLRLPDTTAARKVARLRTP